MTMDDRLFVGVDIAKLTFTAGFVSTDLLDRHQRFTRCPHTVYEQSATGFAALLSRIEEIVPRGRCVLLYERTGHYHKPLLQYLMEHGVTCYWMHVQERPNYMLKSDKRDALGLANRLYEQLALGVQVQDSLEHIRRVLPPTPVAAQLQGLVRRRLELVQDCTRRKNKLTALCDVLFPEFRTMFLDVNKPVALSMREHFPTPADVASASLEELRTAKVGSRPADGKLLALQSLARASIGLHDAHTPQMLVFEQRQLITELKMLQSHLAVIETAIEGIVRDSREGKILLSIPVIGTMQAATIIASIENIGNFPSAGHLKSYFGWAPKVTQTGTSVDSSSLTRGGNHPMKHTMYLIAGAAIQNSKDNEWRDYYHKNIPLKCRYDARKQAYVGKKKVIGAVCGRITRLIYALLMHDHEVLHNLKEGEEAPEPVLYSRDKHRGDRNGRYIAVHARKQAGG